MFERNAIGFLRKWHKEKDHKPLILRGARQVGKTTLVNELGKEFSNYLYFNLEKKSDRQVFETDLPVDDIIRLLFLRKEMAMNEGDTLIFIDEIQNSSKTMSMLRYFYEERPDVFVIAAGSLLENIVDVKASFPVGRVDFLPLRPCTFREFLVALEKNGALEIMTNPALTVTFHDEYMKLFNEYFLVGGMPEAVQHYSEHHDIISNNRIYSRLISAYMDDVEKYTRSNKLTEVVRYIIKYGWMNAGEIISFSSFAHSAYKSREMGEAFRLLQKAMLLELSYPTTSTMPPVIPEMSRRPKLFWFDTGLVNYVGNVRKEVIGTDAIMGIWKGRVAEQMAAQEILALTDDINVARSFWVSGKGEQGAEVDLLWYVDSELIPIEVKAGHNSHLRSLHSFMDGSAAEVAVRIWSGPFSVDDVITLGKKKPFRLINLPFYLIGNIEEIVKRHS